MYIVAGLRNDSAFEPDYPQYDGEYSIAGRFRQFQSAFGMHLTAMIHLQVSTQIVLSQI